MNGYRALENHIVSGHRQKLRDVMLDTDRNSLVPVSLG
jgi:hypothetical protein